MEKFTHVGVEKVTQRKLSILAPVLGKRVYVLVAELVQAAWNDAQIAGKVNDSMLGTAKPEPVES